MSPIRGPTLLAILTTSATAGDPVDRSQEPIVDDMETYFTEHLRP